MKSLDKIYRTHELFKNSRSYISKYDILKELNFSDSTLEKIIRELRDIYGAPLVYDDHYEGYKYVYESEDEIFELPGIWFSGDELAAWFAIYQIISEIPYDLLSQTLTRIKSRIEKIASKVSLTPEKWASTIKILPIGYRKPNEIIFRIIVECLVREKRVNIHYSGIHKPPSWRIVSPVHLVRYRDNWYLDAWCHASEGLRQFELSRIGVAKITNEKAMKIPEEQVNEFYADSYGIFSGKADKYAVIRFTGFAALIVSKETWHPHQKCVYDPEKKECLLTIPYNNGTELIRDVLRWGENAEILEPDELRKTIIHSLSQATKKYL